MSKSRLALAFAAASALSLSVFGAAPMAIRHPGRTHLTKDRHRFNRGEVRFFDYSSLCKLMRAARRGKLPEERLGTIERAQESAAKRWTGYLNSFTFKRYGA